jgi:nucleotide-binding universal stress UspA family protein
MGGILVPVDGSTHSTDALTYAIEHFPDEEITALHVVEAPKGYYAATAANTEELPQVERGKEKAGDLLDEAETAAAEQGTVIDTHWEIGDPVDEILSYAQKEGFDEIVIGSRGISGVGRILFGSVAEAVVRRAEIPVVVVH